MIMFRLLPILTHLFVNYYSPFLVDVDRYAMVKLTLFSKIYKKNFLSCIKFMSSME